MATEEGDKAFEVGHNGVTCTQKYCVHTLASLPSVPVVSDGQAGLAAHVQREYLLREEFPKKRMFTFGHCPNQGGGGGPCPNFLALFSQGYGH